MIASSLVVLVVTAGLLGLVRFGISLKKRLLEESVARYQAIVETAVDGIITIDADGIVQSFNRAAAAIFGYAPEEMIGRNVSLLMPSPDREQHDSYIARYLQTGCPRIIGIGREVEGVRKDGTRFPLYLAVSHTQLRSGHLFTGIVRDLTAQKAAEHLVVLQTQELEEKNRTLAIARDDAMKATRLKSKFLATMSHEIRTPLNGVIGMIELLLDTNLTPEQREFAETARSSGEHLLAVINDILDFSKIEAGKLDIDRTDFDLRAVIEDVLDLLAARAQAKGLELIGLVTAGIPTTLRGDPGRIRQVLLNLTGNAIKFTEQGEVVVRTTVLHENNDSAMIRIEVADTGIGISEEGRTRLFHSFSQADGSTTRQYGGTGLGLAISKRLVELMGGDIGVESQPGAGSRFWFTLPLGKQCGVSRPPTPRADLQGLRVCFVDDNPTNLQLLTHYAATWGMEAESVSSGSRALDRLRAAAEQGKPFDLAVLDWHMPDMDGLETVRAIKADPLLRSVKLVLLTSWGMRGDGSAAQRAGISGYLTKPVRYNQLYECLRRVMGQADQTIDESNEAPNTDKAESEARISHHLVTRHTLKEEESRRKARVLVAEDNPVNQNITVRMVEKLGYRADVVGNGREAVEAVKRIPYHLILMDCMMPEMDGYEATREIRRWEKGESRSSNFEFDVLNLEPSPIPIIALTANAMEGDREKCLEAGMDDFLTKPLKREALQQILERWIASHTHSAPLSAPVPDSA